MIKSMTGFGSAIFINEYFNLSIEIKSINSRYLDCKIKLPKQLEKYEPDLIVNLNKICKRGRVSLYANLDEIKNELILKPQINKDLFESYHKLVKNLNENYKLKLKINDLFDVKDFIDKKEKQFISKKYFLDTFEKALKKLEEMKLIEGAYLSKDIKKRLQKLKKTIEKINYISKKQSSSIKNSYIKKIKKLVEDFQIEDSRIVTEAAILSDKIEITEECVRFNSHIEQMSKLLEESNPVGKKLNFLLQEILRETNTIGSKSNDLKIMNYVILLKEEIEKIKEQSLNIL